VTEYPESVYVVTAHCTDKERIAEVDVFATIEQARGRFRHLKQVYGGANVCLAQRRVYGLDDTEAAAMIRRAALEKAEA
jgi:hypothetical protein